jgi:hypothetical protein
LSEKTTKFIRKYVTTGFESRKNDTIIYEIVKLESVLSECPPPKLKVKSFNPVSLKRNTPIISP